MLSKQKIRAPKADKNMAIPQGDCVGNRVEIHCGGAPCTVSMTHATNNGGIRSNTLLQTLLVMPMINDARYGRRAHENEISARCLIQGLLQIQGLIDTPSLSHPIGIVQQRLGHWSVGNTQRDFLGMQ